MKVEDLFRELSFGELSNLSFSNEGSGEISAGRQNSLIMHINEALLRLYTRFVIRERDLMIELHEGITNYHMLGRFTQSAGTATISDPLYIMDRADPFKDDLVKILEVRDECGWSYPLNDRENVLSMFTPKYNQLQVPDAKDGRYISVIYQAKHEKLQYGVLDAPVFMPDALHGALKVYTAAKVYSAMNGQDNLNKAQELFAQYEAICLDAEARDLVSTTTATTNTKFAKRGFI